MPEKLNGLVLVFGFVLFMKKRMMKHSYVQVKKIIIIIFFFTLNQYWLCFVAFLNLFLNRLQQQLISKQFLTTA